MSNGNDEIQRPADAVRSGEANRTNLIKVLFAIWSALQILAMAYPALTAPTGDGFTRGLNRITAFFGFQGVAGILAITLAIQSFQHRTKLSRIWRIFAAVPITVAALLLLAVLGLILSAQLR